MSIKHCQSAVLEVHTHSDFLVKILNKRQLSQLYFLTGLWLIVTIAFAVWWLQPAHYTEPFRFAFNSFILAWSLIIPGYYFYFLCQMKKPNPELEIPSDSRIAMITTRVPSEPFAKVQKPLPAMKAQSPAHNLIDILSLKQRLHLRILTGLWGIIVIYFLFWWFNPKHFTDAPHFAFNTFLILWSVLLPGYYCFFLSRIKKPNPAIQIPDQKGKICP